VRGLVGLLTPRRGNPRSTVRDRAIRARTRGPADGSSLRIAIAVGLLVGLLPAIALFLASARSGPPPPTEEPVRVAAARPAIATPARRPTPRPTPTPWPLDLWTRMVMAPTPDGESEQVDAEVPVDPGLASEPSSTPAASTVLPAPSPTPEPEVISPEEIERIQAAAKAAIAAEAARATPVSAAVASTKLGSAVPPDVRRWEGMILAASDRYKIDPNLIAALMMTESGGHENALSPVGAVGLMQIMYGPWDPETNIRQGTAILASNLRRYSGRVDLALAGYNAGNGAVAKYGGIPPYRETRAHVFRVLLRYELYSAG